MQQRARLGEALLAQNGERLVMRLAHMQSRGKARGVRQTDLTAKRPPLILARRQVVMVVQAYLAHGAYTRVRQAFDQARFHGIIVEARIMRMHADRQAQARQRARCRIIGQDETRRVGTVGQMRQLIAAGGQHLTRALHRFGQTRLCFGKPAIEALEHIRGVLLHIDDVADEVHAPRRAARELQRRVGQ